MTDADRVLLGEMRRLLLNLHKTLLDWQRSNYELTHGRLQTSQLLQVIFSHDDFAWLRPMSGLIVKMDEAIAGDSPEAPAPAGPLVREAAALISPETGTVYADRYRAALQELPDAVLAHRDLVTLLKLQSAKTST